MNTTQLQFTKSSSSGHSAFVSDVSTPSHTLCCAVLCLVAQSPLTLNPMDCSLPGSSVHGYSPGKNTGVGCHVFLQGIFPTQGWNPYLLALQVDSSPLSHWVSPYSALHMTKAGVSSKQPNHKWKKQQIPFTYASEQHLCNSSREQHQYLPEYIQFSSVQSLSHVRLFVTP